MSLAPTLLSGMSFRWRRSADDSSIFSGVLGSHIVEVRADAESAYFRCGSDSDPRSVEALLRAHLRLDDEIAAACDHAPFLAASAEFREAAAALPGVRVLHILDPLECLVTFMGSANNNIKRCCQMVQSLCAAFPSNSLGTDSLGLEHFAFPTVAQLTSLDESELWGLGWGYRAPRLYKLSRELAARGERFLESLHQMDEPAARSALCELTGVGRKVADCVLPFGEGSLTLTLPLALTRPLTLTRAQVADCVLLFGYRHDGCVPVDTHCYQLAQRWLLRSIRDRPLASAYQVRLSSPSPTPSP